MRAAILVLGAALLSTSVWAQVDPSNPGGAPLAPSQSAVNKPEQGTVLRDAAPSPESDTRTQPRAPSVLNGVEEPQRTGTTRPTKGEAPSNDRDPAPVEPGTTPPR